MKNQAMGVYSEVRLCPEVSLKEAPSNFTGKIKSMPFNSTTVASSQNTTDPSTMTGRRDAVEAIYGNIDVAGDIVVPVDSQALPYWLAAAFGSPTTSTLESGKYKHVFKAGKTQPSFLIEKAFNNGVYAVESGCKVSKLAFSFGGDGELTATVTVMGCNEEINDTPLLASVDKVAMQRFNNFQASIKVDGEEVEAVTEISCDIDFGLDSEGYAIGNKGFRSRVNEGVIKPSGSLTAFFDDKSYVEKAMNSTKTAIEVAVTRGDVSMTIKLPEVKFPRSTPGIEGATGITQSLDYSAFYENSSEGTCVVIEIVNDVESYKFEG